MIRKSVATVALLVFAGGVLAAEHRGRVKSVDATKGTITLTTGRMGMQQDKTFTVAKDAKFTSMNREVADKLATQGLKHETFTRTGRMAAQVTLVTEGEGDKEVVKEVRVGGRRPQP
jgi:hypothetical protein